MPGTERDIVIGKIVAPFGIRGEVKVVILTDFPERFDAGAEMLIRPVKGSERTSVIEKSYPHKGGLNVKFRGVDDMDTAEGLRGAEIVIDRSEVGELPDDSFYLFDLIGLKVVTDDGREQGEVVEILQGGANDVYVTSTGLCIPALKDVVTRVDIEGGQVVIRPVPGLLPEDRDAD